MSEPEALARMAASRKFSLLTTNDLRAAGFEANDVTALVRHGDLTRISRGWYVVGAPTWDQRVGVVVARVGRPYAISHRAAARIHGLWRDDEIDVTVRAPADVRIAGVAVHRSVDLVDDDVSLVDGIWVTTVARTLVDLGLVVSQRWVRAIVEHAIANEMVDVADLLAIRERVGEHGRNGVGAVDAAVASLPAQAHLAESGPEVRLMSLIGESGLPTPVPQYEIRLGRRRYRVDLAFPAQRIAIEYDGEGWHSTPEQVRADRDRQRRLEALGWTVLRYRRADLFRTDNGQILADIRLALARAANQRSVGRNSP